VAPLGDRYASDQRIFLGFASNLADTAALDGYYPHPAHRAFAETVTALAEKITDFAIVD